MPQVPYNPVPSVSLQGANPKVSVNAPGAAFGENIGKAIEGAGSTLEGAGNALFTRSLEIQRLRLEGQVNDAVTQSIEQSAKGLDQYKLRLGNDATADDALDKQLQANKDIFKTGRDSLPNDYARRMFDRQTLSSFRYADIHAAAHAATEQKRATLGSWDAREKLDEVQAQKIPMWDDQRFDTVLRDVESSARGRASARGQSPEELSLYIFNRKSAMYAARAKGINQEDPIAAQKFMELHRQDMTPQDWFSASRPVIDSRGTVVSRVTSDNVNAHHEGPGYPAWMTPQERQKADSVLEPVSRIYRQFAIDSPEFRAQVTSGARTPEQNKAVGGAADSQHLTAGAMDIVVKGDMAQAMAKIQDTANKLGIPIKFESLGKSKDHIHFQLADGTDPHSLPRPVPESESSRATRGTNYAADQYPDDPNQGPKANNRILGDYNHIKTQVRDQQQQYDQAVAGAILGGDGLPRATSIEEVKHRLEQATGNADAWNNLDPKKQMQYYGVISRGNREITDMARYRTLLDMGYGDSQEKQREFAYMNLTNEPIDDSKLKTLLQRQRQITGKPGSDPRLAAAKAVMPPGLTRDMSKEDQDELNGQMIEELQVLHARNKTMPSDKEMVELWKNLTFQQVTKKNFLGYGYESKGEKYFKQPLSEAEVLAEYPGLIRRYGKEPTREEAERAARISKYKERFGGSATKEKTEPQQAQGLQVPERK